LLLAGTAPDQTVPGHHRVLHTAHYILTILTILTIHTIHTIQYLATIASFSIGVTAAWTGLLNNYLTVSEVGFTDKQVGWMGFAAILAGTLFGIVIGAAVDRFQLPLRHVAMALIGMGAAALIVFVVEVYVIGHPRFWVVFFAVLFVGISANSIGPLLYEMAADLTYPVSEETSAVLLTIGYAVVSVTSMTVGGIIDARVANTAFAVMMVAATLGAYFVSDKSERRAVDELGGG
jgi:FLVCR family feline leukemia virus subgroup C receptor-related protein